jgi:hypothetical protein
VDVPRDGLSDKFDEPVSPKFGHRFAQPVCLVGRKVVWKRGFADGYQFRQFGELERVA